MVNWEGDKEEEVKWQGRGNRKLADFSDVERKSLKKWKGTPYEGYSRKKECSEKGSSLFGFLKHSLSSCIKGAIIQGCASLL